MKKISLVLFLIASYSLYAGPWAYDLHTYFTANCKEFSGNISDAAACYQSLLGNTTNCPYLYKGYAHTLYKAGNLPQLIQITSKLDELFKNDEDIQLILAQVYEKTGNKSQAEERFIRLNSQFKGNQEIAFSAAHCYLRRQEPENAIKVIDDLLNCSPRKMTHFIFYFMKSQIYLQLRNKEEALKSVQKSIELHPRFDKGWLLFALLQEQAGQLTEAIKGYTSFLELTGYNREIEQHLLKLTFKQKVEGKSSNTLTMNKSCFQKALLLFEQKQYKKALETIDGCLQEKPDSDETKLLKIQILTSMQQGKEAADLLKTWITKEPTNPTWYKTLHLLTQTGVTRSYAISVLQGIEKECPTVLTPVLYLADLYIRENNHKKALFYLKKAYHAQTQTDIKQKILFQMAMLYYQTHNTQGMNFITEHTKELTISYAPLLNILAYHYASDNDLPRAEKYCSAALEQHATNPHFLDTKALIHYKKKDYKLALEILQTITKVAPMDFVITLHLAQAQYQCGDAHAAKLSLTKAQSLAKTKQEQHDVRHLLNTWTEKK